MKQDAEHRSAGTAILFFGSLWGLSESLIGFFAHALQRIIPVPGLPAYILFPITLFLLFSLVRQTGNAHTVLGATALAVLLKTSSGLLPSIPWIFVINPALALIAEGLAIWAAAVFMLRRRTFHPVRDITAVSVIWRVFFLLSVALFSPQKGILMKGPFPLAVFILIDPFITALLVSVPLRAMKTTSLQRPAPDFPNMGKQAPAALFLALAAQFGVSLIS